MGADAELVLKRYSETGNSAVVAKEFNIGVSTVLKIVKAAGVKVNAPHARRLFLDDDVARMNDAYNSGKSQADIAKEFNITQQGIGKMLRRCGGFAVRKTKAWATMNEHFFDVIDTEEKAYWLGFFCADGYFNEKNNSICLTLSTNDADHVCLFAAAIEFKGKVRDRRDGERFETQLLFKSKVMCDALRGMGLSSRKSKDLIIPSNIPNEVVRHFWRGMIDGDGTLPVHERYGHRRDTVELIGTESVCRSFKQFGELVAGKMQEVRVHERWSNVGVEGVVARKLMNVLYGGATVFLKRKYDIAMGRFECADGVSRTERVFVEEFLKKYHYLKTMPIGVVSYGLWENNELKGVAVIGQCSNPGVGESVLGKNSKHVVELRRFALVDGLPKNTASSFLAKVLKAIKKEYLGWWVLVSFADSAQGHIGTIYQACGARYLGSGRAEVVVVTDVGERISGRHMVNQLRGKDLSGSKVEFSEGKLKYVFILQDEADKLVSSGLPYVKAK